MVCNVLLGVGGALRLTSVAPDKYIDFDSECPVILFSSFSNGEGQVVYGVRFVQGLGCVS